MMRTSNFTRGVSRSRSVESSAYPERLTEETARYPAVSSVIIILLLILSFLECDFEQEKHRRLSDASFRHVTASLRVHVQGQSDETHEQLVG